MAGKPIGTVFVELDLNTEGYTKKQKDILRQTQSTSLQVEKNWRTIGQQSDKMYDAMRQNVNNAYASMVNSGKLSAAELVRAEQAKAAKINSINEQQFGKQMTLMENLKSKWMGIAAFVAAAYYTIQKAWDLAAQAAEYEQSRQAFRSMAERMGADAEEVFGKVRKLSGGLIDDASLTQSMNKALSLGIPIEKLGDLMLIARAKSRDMGITATQAFNDIATGIGRGSPLILDNLGLMLKLGSANEAMAASLGKTVEQLTDKEKKTAILNATLDAGKEALSRYNLEVLTTKERMDALKVQFLNITHVIGGFILRVGAGLMATFQAVAAAALSLASMLLTPIEALARATDYLGITQGKAEKLRETMEALSEASRYTTDQGMGNLALMTGGFGASVGVGPGPRSTGAGATTGGVDGAKIEEEYFKRKMKLLAEYSDGIAAFYGDEAELSKMAAEEEIKAFEARQKAREADAKSAEKYAADRIASLESIQNAQRAEMEMTDAVKPYSAQDAYDTAFAYGNVALAIEQVNAGLGDQWAQLEAGQSMIDLYKTAWLDANLAIYDSITSLYTGMQGWISSSLQGLVTGAMSAMDVVKNLGKMMLGVITDYIAKWVVSRLFMAAMEKVFLAQQVATTTAAAGIIATAWMPAAYLATVATLGGAAAEGVAALGLGMASAAGLLTTMKAAGTLGGGLSDSVSGGTGAAFASGTDYVPQTMPAFVHKGERILTPEQNKDFTDFLGGKPGSGESNQINLYIDGERLASWMHRASRQGRLNLVPA